MEKYSEKMKIEPELTEVVKDDIYFCLIKENNEINFRFCLHNRSTGVYYSLSNNQRYHGAFDADVEDRCVVNSLSYEVTSVDYFLDYFAQKNFNIYLIVNDVLCGKENIAIDELNKAETKINSLRNKSVNVDYKEKVKLLRESYPKL